MTTTRRRGPRLTDTGVSWLGALATATVVALVVVVLVDRPAGPRTTSSATTTSEPCSPAEPQTMPGQHTFTVTNPTDQRQAVRLVSASLDTTFARVDGLAPGATRDLTLTLAPGGYAWRCVADDGTVSTSGSWTVDSPADGPLPDNAVTAAELDDAVSTYRASLGTELRELQVGVDALVVAAADDDLAGARSNWLAAHLAYERMGAAYGTFGELDGALNGRPEGLEGGVDDPGFTGFHRIEHLLWAVGPTDWSAVQEQAAGLAGDVATLAATLPVLFTDPADLPLRAHEILEGSLQFELNGLSDQGSGTELATVRANVDGTRLVLDALAPALTRRAPELVASVSADLDALTAALEARHRADGSWTRLDQVPAAERRRIDALVGRLVEQLAAVPGLLSLPTASS